MKELNYISQALYNAGATQPHRAVKTAALLKMLGRESNHNNVCKLQDEIRFFRRAWTGTDDYKNFILSGSHGYYVSDDKQEHARFVRSESHRAIEIFTTSKAMRAELKRQGKLE